MKVRLAILLFMTLLVFVVGIFLLYRHQLATEGDSKSVVVTTNHEPSVRLGSPQNQPEPLSSPVAPPRPPGSQSIRSQPEPNRVLVGASPQEIQLIEQHLPSLGKVVVYPISHSKNAAAIATGDLNNDGEVESVVAYQTFETKDQALGPSLTLAILTTRNHELVVAATTRLYGTYIQNDIVEKHTVPFAIRNVTGGKYNQILVTSSIRASLGTVLEIFSFESSSLRKIAEISGDLIQIMDGDVHNPSLVTVKSLHEKQTKTYRWNGQRFQESG
jgi:hypothetical protein